MPKYEFLGRFSGVIKINKLRISQKQPICKSLIFQPLVSERLHARIGAGHIDNWHGVHINAGVENAHPVGIG